MLAREGMDAICRVEVRKETGRYFCPMLAREGMEAICRMMKAKLQIAKQREERIIEREEI